MAKEFLGEILSVENENHQLVITGHAWVGLAFDQDGAIQVTRFVDCDPADLTKENLEHLADASDAYDCDVSQVNGRSVVRILVFNEIEIIVHCSHLIVEYRYYNAEEIRQIFEWLPQRASADELKKHLEDIKRHGYCVTLKGDSVTVACAKG